MAMRNAKEVARLIGWCRNVGDACVQRYAGSVFRTSLMEELQKEKLLKACAPVYGWRLTRKGYRFLQDSGIPLQPDAHTQRVGRRFEHAEITATMYAAGINPYLTAIEELRSRDGYLPAFVLRARRGQQVLGNNQMAGHRICGVLCRAQHGQGRKSCAGDRSPARRLHRRRLYLWGAAVLRR